MGRRALATTPAVHAGALNGCLTHDDIVGLPSAPAISPSFPLGPYRFVNREYCLIEYETDLDRLKKVVPWPLKPTSNRVIYEWINMPDSSGFGSYSESGCIVPCELNGQSVNYTLSMYLDDEPPTAAGREIWGFPKRHGLPRLKVEKDTLTGSLTYVGQEAALGTMVYKHTPLSEEKVREKLCKTTCNLRLIPDVNGGLARAQLVGFELEDVTVHEAWSGPARLHLVPHATTPAADLTVRRVIGGTHVRTDLTLPHGRVLYDYNNPTDEYGTPDMDQLHPAEILKAPSMPIMAPSYPRKFSTLRNREYVFFKFKTDVEILRQHLPELCEVNPEGDIYFAWISTEGHGLGAYNKCDIKIPCTFKGKPYLFSVLAVLDSGVALNAGREILGQPCKYGFPTVAVEKDTLACTLRFGEQLVATGTSVFKYQRADSDEARDLLTTPELNLKFIPGVDGRADIAQLVSVKHGDVHLDDSLLYTGKGRLALRPHVNAPLADFPVQSDSQVLHVRVNSMSIKQTQVVHDYLA
ncbi:uncharacterized protein MONBRDRAFT_29605 [Monosiga brevicollis MX1]|uniref:Acetoacetate decarboxylase n=1 Tax=Monosiga brevicollis TaxID=81824 RepID=A9VBK8_MONBE|nr:uncharacterized protein MONBRDRAFT_29605 [Monosiga brevicollis MX1]EDQ85114.1 predicted protein [Monosiga brevicollis MX1]|eukprot:XP_001750118.1 hypothetical protein [Monosiga brevicollis MX1]